MLKFAFDCVRFMELTHVGIVSVNSVTSASGSKAGISLMLGFGGAFCGVFSKTLLD